MYPVARRLMDKQMPRAEEFGTHTHTHTHREQDTISFHQCTSKVRAGIGHEACWVLAGLPAPVLHAAWIKIIDPHMSLRKPTSTTLSLGTFKFAIFVLVFSRIHKKHASKDRLQMLVFFLMAIDSLPMT